MDGAEVHDRFSRLQANISNDDDQATDVLTHLMIAVTLVTYSLTTILTLSMVQQGTPELYNDYELGPEGLLLRQRRGQTWERAP